MFDRFLKWLGTDEAGRKRLIRIYGEFKKPYLTGAFFLILTNFFVLAIPVLIGDMVDRVRSVSALGEEDLAWLGRSAGLIILLAALGNAARILSRLLIFNAGREIEYRLRNEVFNRYVRYPMKTFSDRTTGDLMSRATNDLSQVRLLFGFGLLNFVNTPILFPLGFGLMFAIHWKLAIAAVAVFPIFIVFVQRFSRSMFEMTLKVQEKMSAITGVAQETFNGIQAVKSYTLEDRQQKSFEKASDEYYRLNARWAIVRGAIFNLTLSVSRFSALAVLIYGGYLIIDGQLTLGRFITFNIYLAMLTWPTMLLGMLIPIWQRGVASLSRIEEVLAEPVEETGEDEQATALAGTIEFRDFSFRYPAHKNRVSDSEPDLAVRNVSFSVSPRQTVAIVGPTGCGKSTLGSALLGLYEIEPGAVFVDGRDLCEIPLSVLRQRIGFVTQDHFLFSDTLAANLAFGQPDADSERIREIARLADLDRDVSAFPERYETYVGERGVTLSGGQRQRAALARALMRPTDILVLDDVFSNVDLKTEETILANLRGLQGETTLLLITHRIATAARADSIVVMNEGTVEAIGTHNELLQSSDTYAEMARLQKLEEEMGSLAS